MSEHDRYAPYASIPEMLFQRVRNSPERRAIAVPNADDTGVVWTTWAEIGDRVTALAAGLRALGLQTGDRVAIAANTRIEWVLLDLAVNCAGAATTTVYPTTEAEEASYIVADSGSTIFVAENGKQARKLDGADTSVTHTVLIDGEAGDGEITLAGLEERGRAALTDDPGLIERVAATIGLDDLASVIYTSGTTGRPRGVELTHRAWIWQAVAQDEVGVLTPEHLHYLWLPLSHAFGKSLLTSMVHVGTPTYVDGRSDRIIDMMPVVKPTLMCAAPRIFEKVYNRAVTSGTSEGGLTAKVFEWAVRVGKRKIRTDRPGFLLNAQYALAERLVFSKLQARLGGKGIVLVSGAAPLSRDIADFFAAAGLPIIEGYGLTEASAVSFVNRPEANRIGTVGRPLGDLEVKLDEDGEVLIRAGSVMRAYHHAPEATAQAFTEDGFLRTGDIGRLDDGYLIITDRKKDLVKTSGGKYIAPSEIENQFKAVCPFVSQAVVVAQGRNFVTMLITLDEDALGGRSLDQALADPATEKTVAGYVDQLNAKLNRWETVKKFTILPRDLSIEEGEITPSMKVKRAAVEKAFGAQIDAMYSGTVAQL